MLEIGIMNKNNISKLSDILKKEKSVEFKYNNLFYEIFESCDTGYIVNLYSSDEKDDNGEYLKKILLMVDYAVEVLVMLFGLWFKS